MCTLVLSFLVAGGGLLVLAETAPPSEGASNSWIELSTTQAIYHPGDTLEVQALVEAVEYNLTVWAPEGQALYTETASGSLTYQSEVTQQWAHGTYRVSAQRLDDLTWANRTFEVSLLEPQVPESCFQGEQVALTLDYHGREPLELDWELLDGDGEPQASGTNLTTLPAGWEYEVDEATIALWHLDERDGLRAWDSTGIYHGLRGGWGTGNHTPYYDEGIADEALHFTGATSPPYDVNGSYVRLDSTPELNLTDDLTIELWVKPLGEHPNPPLLTNHKPYDDTNGWALSLGGAGDRPVFTAFHPEGNADIYGPTPIPFGTWTHLAFTFNDTSDDYAWYYDGVLVRRGNHDINITGNPYDIIMGAVYTGTPDNPPYSTYNGSIDEVRLSSIAREPEELRVHRRAQVAVNISREARPGTWTLRASNANGSLMANATFTVRPMLALDSTLAGEGQVKVTGELRLATGEALTLRLLDPTGTQVATRTLNGTLERTPLAEMEGTVGYWPLDSIADNVTRDESGDLHHGTLVYGPQATVGRWDEGLLFDGMDDHLQLPIPGPGGSDPRTIMVWAKTESSQQQYLLTYGGTAAQAGSTFRAGLNGACQGVYIGVSDGYLIYEATTADGDWHHYAFVVPDQGELRGRMRVRDILVYQDGRLLTETCSTFKPDQMVDTGNEHDMRVATYHDIGDHYFAGTLDDLYVNERELAPWEFCLKQHYQEVVVLPDRPIPGTWTLEVSTPSGYYNIVDFIVYPQKEDEGFELPLLPDGAPGLLLLALGGFFLVGVVYGLGRDEHFRWWLQSTLLLPLFSHIREEELEEPDRFKAGELYQIIVMNPGIHLKGLKAITGMQNGNLVYHLERLERGGKIASSKLGQLRIYHLIEPENGELMETEPPSRIQYLRGTQKQVLEVLASHPEITQRQIADRLGVNQQLVSYHLRELGRKDHVERLGIRGFYTYRVQNEVLSELEGEPEGD